jgi:hypothetical protein
MVNYLNTSGFWPRVRARALGAPVILGQAKRGAARPPPPIPASLLLIRPQQINENYRKLCAGATITLTFFVLSCFYIVF